MPILMHCAKRLFLRKSIFSYLADLVARNDGHVMENICYGKLNLYQKKAFCTKVQVLFFLSQFSQNPEFRSIIIVTNKDFF